uniref:ANK_REP_REGION domain-containing protein n=1 Tax=Rhabditophanes sp. KR3021 TaxID=114890 RepID=A0AC35UHT0_9BILA
MAESSQFTDLPPVNQPDFYAALQHYIGGKESDKILIASRYIDKCMHEKEHFFKWTIELFITFNADKERSGYNMAHIGFLCQMLRLSLIKHTPHAFSDELKNSVLENTLLMSKQSYAMFLGDENYLSPFNCIINCFTCFYLVAPSGNDFTRDFRNWFLEQGENNEFLYLTALSYLFDEMSSKKIPIGENKRDCFKELFATHVEDFITFIQSYLARVPMYSKYYNKVIAYSSNLMRNDKIKQENEKYLQYLGFILGIIFTDQSDEETHEIACNLIMDIMYIIEQTTDNFVSLNYISTFINTNFRFVEELASKGGSRRLKNICRMIVEKAESCRFEIADNMLEENHPSFSDVRYIIAIANLGMEYADMTLPFWGEISEALLQMVENEPEIYQQIRHKLAGPLSEYFKILISQMQVDPDLESILNQDEHEEMIGFRGNMYTVVSDACALLGGHETLMMLASWLPERPNDWRWAESIICMLAALGNEVGYDSRIMMDDSPDRPHEDYYKSMLRQFMVLDEETKKSPLHPQTLYSVFEVLMEFADWMNRYPEMQAWTVEFLLAHILDTRYTDLALKILQTFVEDGQYYDIACIQYLLKLPEHLEKSPTDCYKTEQTIQTVYRVCTLMINANFQTPLFPYIHKMVTDSLERLRVIFASGHVTTGNYAKLKTNPWADCEGDPIVYFHRITSVTRKTNFVNMITKAPDLKDVILKLEASMWETIYACLTKLKTMSQVDHAVAVVRFMFRNGYSLKMEIALKMIHMFLNSRHYPLMYIISIAIDTEGDTLMKMPEFLQPLRQLMDICATNFKPSGNEFRNLTEAFDDFMRINNKLIKCHHRFFLALPQSEAIFQLALQAIEYSTDHDNTCHCGFIENFYILGSREKSNPASEVQVLCMHHMKQVIEVTIRALLLKLHRERKSSICTDMLCYVYAFDQDQFVGILWEVIETIPQNGLLGATRAQKMDFVTKIRGLSDKRSSSHQFNLIINDFARLYN